MSSTLTIPKKTTSETALDHRQLYAIGLAHVQRLARHIWTDYNVHDPGITILELLCYGLTDLGYRASFPVKDLLATKTDNAENMARQFFTAREILPNRPLTLADYRKLLIDIKGIKNGWLIPAKQRYYADPAAGTLLRDHPGRPEIQEITLAGLYEVLIEYDAEDAATQAKVEAEARRRLQANRNLCEDFIAFTKVRTQRFKLCYELELSAEADQSAVQAETLFAVQQYLAPPVRNYTLEEMLARCKADGNPYAVDEIFAGPALDCGFIDEEELARAELRTEIRLSDLIGLLMDIQGVQAVRDIVIQPEDAPPPDNKWVIPVVSGRKALLNPAGSRLVFYKRNMPVSADPARTQALLAQLQEGVTAKTDLAVPYDLPIPQGQFRDPVRYHSLQNHFPPLYGLSEFGLSSTADEQRRAQANQLKGYLLFFDQILADYLAQLGQVRTLFSTDADVQATYFHQAVTSFAGFEQLYGAIDADRIVEKIEALVTGEEEQNVQAERRNRFLDHLIARFAEQFTEFAHLMHAEFGTRPQQMSALKCAFLNDYPAISSERALAWNASLKEDAALWNSQNISGLERRLARLLGIRNPCRRNLGDVAYDIYVEIDQTPQDDFRFRIRNRDTGKIILSSSTRYTTADLAWEEMRRAVQLGQLPSAFQRKVATDGRLYFNVIDETGEVIARRIEYFNDPELRDAAIDETMEYLQVNYSEEGMYLIENILLRPDDPDDPFLPICTGADRNVCAENDPYSYRLHIVLPAYGSRFRSMAFRRFAEEVIRAETPAHILPKICWVSQEDMARFEQAYRDWIYLKAGREKSRRQEKLSRFICELFSIRNVYPSQRLRACAADEERSLFILGQTGLGTEKTDES
jgi:hypothetical protein